ncbi:Pyruvate/Phosphoenolpyruvate kinase-like domain-containing protein, partial [Cladochytrium replicatum]
KQGNQLPRHPIDELPALSEKDRADIDFGLTNDVDFILLSCIRTSEDAEEIENESGMENFESILRLADGVVIDRGYLGAEVDANLGGKPVFLANQMLEPMNHNPYPLGK